MNLLFEIIGSTMGHFGMHNIWLYNISDFIRFPLWFWFFYCIFESVKQKKVALAFSVGFPVIWVILAFYQKITVFQTYSFIIGSILLLTLCFLCLYNEYKSNSTEPVFNNPTLWICLGLLFYYSLNLPFIGLYNWLYSISSNFTLTYFYVCVVGSSLLLSLFIIKAFLCNLKNRKFGS